MKIYLVLLLPILGALLIGCGLRSANSPAPTPVIPVTATSTVSPSASGQALFTHTTPTVTPSPKPASPTSQSQAAETSLPTPKASSTSIAPTALTLLPSPTTTPIIESSPVRSGVPSTKDASTLSPGELRWDFETNDRIEGTVIEADGVIFVTSRDGTLYALDADSGLLVWSHEFGNRISAPATMTGLVFLGSFDRHLYALNASTGEIEWKFNTQGPNLSSPAVAKGMIFFGSSDDFVYALDAKTGILQWKQKTDGSIPSAPTFANGILYVGSRDDHIYAFEAKTGTRLWKSELGATSPTKPAVGNDLVYVGSWDDRVYALNAATGNLEWNFWTGGNVVSSPTVANGVLYIGSDDKHLYALDARTGTLRWKFRAGGRVSSPPTVADGVVYAGSSDNNLYALDAETGGFLWKYETGGEVSASPIAVGDTVFAGSEDNVLYAMATGPVSGQDLSETVTASEEPTRDFVPLEPAAIKDILTVFSEHSLASGSVSTSDPVLISQAIGVFETGYYLLTGVPSAEDGLIPRILSKEEYDQFVNEKRDGDIQLKAVDSFCCERTSEGLELIVNGSTPLHAVVSNLAHEAGHARQVIINPVQNKYARDTNVGAVREAQAFAFQAALLRIIGEEAGVNATLFPIESTAASLIENWIESATDKIEDYSEEHLRGQVILWLAVLNDDNFAEIKEELIEQTYLSPKSLLAVQNWLIDLVPAKIDAYVNRLSGKIEADKSLIQSILMSKFSDVRLEGFARHSSTIFLVP